MTDLIRIYVAPSDPDLPGSWLPPDGGTGWTSLALRAPRLGLLPTRVPLSSSLLLLGAHELRKEVLLLHPRRND